MKKDTLEKKIKKINIILNPLVDISSVAFVFLAIIDFALFLTPQEAKLITAAYRFIWILFLLDAVYRLAININQKNKKLLTRRIFTVLLIFSTFLPLLMPQFFGLTSVRHALASKYYFTFVMVLLSAGNISQKIVGFFNRKTNPALLMAASFSFIIVIGSLILLSPRCNTIHLSITDAAFVATSAVCVTGLTPVDVSTAFTLEGQIVILLLIQIGGLGVMTLTSFFAVFFTGNLRVANQLTVKDMISSGTLNSLFSMLLYILGFTLLIEATGAAAILYSIHGTLNMNLEQEIFFSVFHAISAFCNGGFSTLGGNLGNPMLMNGHNLLFIIISLLIVFGGIGFPLLVNLVHLAKYYIRRFVFQYVLRKKKTKRVTHIININTKIVLITTAILLGTGTFALALFEWNRAFAGLSVEDKLTQAFFNSASTRTAGFSSINLTLFSTPSLLVYLFLMWIGGAAQSTAGGIKVNTFATALLSVKAILYAEDRVEVFKREISKNSITRAYGTIFVSMMMMAGAIFALSMVEPEISLFKLAFEVFSAIATVGSSLDTTALLGVPGKMIIIVLMFTGRIGIFTLLVSFIKRKPHRNYRFPEEQIIIN